MAVYEVGKPYNPGMMSWPEAAQYNYRQGGHELVLFYLPPIDDDEVMAVTKQEARFGVDVEGDVIFFLYRFTGDEDWSDCPYSIHLVPPDQRTVPPILGNDELVLLSVILVDAESGIVRGLRAVTLSRTVSRALVTAIRAQAAKPWDVKQYDFQLTQAHQRISVREMARRGVTCKAGEK
jgi:hypothetical protein